VTKLEILEDIKASALARYQYLKDRPHLLNNIIEKISPKLKITQDISNENIILNILENTYVSNHKRTNSDMSSSSSSVKIDTSDPIITTDLNNHSSDEYRNSLSNQNNLKCCNIDLGLDLGPLDIIHEYQEDINNPCTRMNNLTKIDQEQDQRKKRRSNKDEIIMDVCDLDKENFDSSLFDILE
jgi:hypothetical protein